jgi:hypothetical protein
MSVAQASITAMKALRDMKLSASPDKPKCDPTCSGI